MEKRDPLRDVANTSTDNEPQQSVDDTVKEQDAVATSSDNKENGFSHKARKSFSDTDVGSGSKPKETKPRLSFLKAFDPLYSDSPEKSRATTSSKSDPEIRHQLIIEEIDESESSHSARLVDVSDDDEGAFVDASTATDEGEVSENRNLQREESLLTFYTPDRVYVARKGSDSEAATTSELADNRSVLLDIETSTSSNANDQPHIQQETPSTSKILGEIVSAINRKLNSDCDIIPTRSKFTITESELENFTLLRERFNDNRDSNLRIHQESAADAIEPNSLTSISEIRNISPERSTVSVDSGTRNAESTESTSAEDEQQSENKALEGTEETGAEKGESSDDSQESKVTVIEKSSATEVDLENKRSDYSGDSEEKTEDQSVPESSASEPSVYKETKLNSSNSAEENTIEDTYKHIEKEKSSDEVNKVQPEEIVKEYQKLERLLDPDLQLETIDKQTARKSSEEKSEICSEENIEDRPDPDPEPEPKEEHTEKLETPKVDTEKQLVEESVSEGESKSEQQLKPIKKKKAKRETCKEPGEQSEKDLESDSGSDSDTDQRSKTPASVEFNCESTTLGISNTDTTESPTKSSEGQPSKPTEEAVPENKTEESEIDDKPSVTGKPDDIRFETIVESSNIQSITTSSEVEPVKYTEQVVAEESEDKPDHKNSEALEESDNVQSTTTSSEVEPVKYTEQVETDESVDIPFITQKSDDINSEAIVQAGNVQATTTSSEVDPVKHTKEVVTEENTEVSDKPSETKKSDDINSEVTVESGTTYIHHDEEHHLDSGVDSIEESFIKSPRSQVGDSEGSEKSDDQEVSTEKEDSCLPDEKLNHTDDAPKIDCDDQAPLDKDSKTVTNLSVQDEQSKLLEEPARPDIEKKIELLVDPAEPEIHRTTINLTDNQKSDIKISSDIDTFKTKMADLSEKLSEQQQENSDLKLQLNAIQQAKASLELEIRQKEEVIIKTQAEALKNEQIYKQEIKQLREKLKENSKLIEKDGTKELEDQLKEAKAREAKAIAELNQRTKDDLNYQKIMEEYENTISTRFADHQKLKEEHETATRHLANIELAFSDVHQKYERTKALLEGFKSNEDSINATLQSSEKTCKQHEERYESLKAHAKAQIEKSNKEIIMLRDKYEMDINKLKAIIKRLEIKCSSLEVSLQQKTEECAALSALCDEVTGKKV